MPKLSNCRYEAFAQAIASGAPLRESYEDAGFHGDLSHACRLARRGEVVARVDELRREQADLDEARPTSVIVALVRMARAAEGLKTAAGVREARETLLEAQRLHAAQIDARQNDRLTVLDDDEWDAAFRSLGATVHEGSAARTAPPMVGH
jgi:hypothetical protein